MENWYFASRYLEPAECFIRRVHQWRNASGGLGVALVIRGRNFTDLQVDYAFRYLEENIDWVEHHPFENQPQIRTMVYKLVCQAPSSSWQSTRLFV